MTEELDMQPSRVYKCTYCGEIVIDATEKDRKNRNFMKTPFALCDLSPVHKCSDGTKGILNLVGYR